MEIKCSECGKVFQSNDTPMCPLCEKQWARDRYEQIEKQMFYGIEFVALRGTEKQVKWANRVRKHWIMDMLANGAAARHINPLLSTAVYAKTWLDARAMATHDITRMLTMIYRENADTL